MLKPKNPILSRFQRPLHRKNDAKAQVSRAPQSRFRRTLPERVVAEVVAVDCAVLATAARFVVALVTPFLIELMTVFLVDVAAVVPAVALRAVDAAVPAAGRPALRTTVDVLPSLDSLVPLILLTCRAVAAVVDREAAVATVVVAVAVAGAVAVVVAVLVFAAAPRPRVRAAVAVVPPAAELAVEDVVGLRVLAVREARAFSTMELIMFVVDVCFVGDMGRAIDDLKGDCGAGAARSRSRGLTRELDDAGERTCTGCVPDAPGRLAPPRWRFLGFS